MQFKLIYQVIFGEPWWTRHLKIDKKQFPKKYHYLLINLLLFWSYQLISI